MADEISAMRTGTSHDARFHVFEVRSSGESLSPGMTKLFDSLAHPGRSGVIQSAPFWMATETIRAELTAAFLSCIAQTGAGA